MEALFIVLKAIQAPVDEVSSRLITGVKGCLGLNIFETKSKEWLTIESGHHFTGFRNFTALIRYSEKFAWQFVSSNNGAICSTKSNERTLVNDLCYEKI